MGQIPLYTIGYGARDIADFIAVLQANDIAYLIDVRSKPYSRYKPDFTKQALERHLQAADIRYVFMGDTLGGMPDDPDCYDAEGKVVYEKVAQKAFYHQGIGRLQDAFDQQLRVAIMCSEGKPENCHRTKLISKTLIAQDVPVVHIDENDQLITHQSLAVPPPLPLFPEEPDYFAEEEAFSPYDEYEALSLFDEWIPPEPVEPTLPSAELPKVSADLAGAKTLLKRVFGFDQFRPLQEEIITHLLQKRDALAIMPTGSGKSLCFQLPALLFSGLTVVVSPLISLMQDQVEQLRELGIPAVFLNSSLSHSDYLWTTRQIRDGNVKLLYAAPETLVRPETLLLLEQTQVDCLTIDEAHCISEWGHDFRPEYRQLVDIRRRLPQAACIAVTATATERVRQDIISSLEIPQAGEFIASFNRENLHLAVEPKVDGLAQTLAFLESHPDQSGIIYCATRKQVDILTELLTANGWSALPYHAGMDSQTRSQNQRRFINDDIPIMVATIAFGMGINKSNVRFILHYDLPKNIESYYQQIGRAGRDGLQSDCLLLFSYADVQTIQYFIRQQEESQQVGARVRLDAMISFVETNLCRRKPLLTYFGEAYDVDNCELCDNCLSQDEALTDLTVPAQKFLSCVKRTGEIFGMSHIIDVLRGSQNQKVLGRGHDKLSTYNIGSEFSKKEWQYLARQFIQQDLLIQDMEHGSLKLTPKAYAVFKGEQVFGTMPDKPRTAVTTGQQVEYDRPLFDLLRQKRKTLADEVGVPPYVIFSDRSLVEMAAYFPHSRKTFTNIYGVGEAKLNSYADDFLPIIQSYCLENGLEEKRKLVTVVQSVPGRKNRTEEILDLYNNGRSIPEICALYGTKQSTVLNHLWKSIQAGKQLREGNLRSLSELPADEQQRVLDAFGELGVDYLRPVYDAMNTAVSYDELHLLRLHFVSQNSHSDV
ncbi:MAG: DNA helicase RecQ [Candidatus Promineifilaceae bacterium]